MRVFHFVDENHGLDNLRKRRLKIATLNELNDPFELFGVNLGNDALRHSFRVMKNELAQKTRVASIVIGITLYSGVITLLDTLGYVWGSMFLMIVSGQSRILANDSS